MHAIFLFFCLVPYISAIRGTYNKSIMSRSADVAMDLKVGDDVGGV